MDLKNKFITKASMGFSLGIFIGIFITAVTATLSAHDGSIYIYNTALAERIGNFLLSFCIELLCYGLLGVVGMGGTVLTYENDRISLFAATVLHFVMVVIVFSAIGFYLEWIVPEEILVNVIFYGCFIAAYVMIWLIQSSIYKKEIKDINSKIQMIKDSDMGEQ